MKPRIKTINFFAEPDKEVIAKVEVYPHTETYGEDRDGNRGVQREFVDDVKVVEIKDYVTGDLLWEEGDEVNEMVEEAYERFT